MGTHAAVCMQMNGSLSLQRIALRAGSQRFGCRIQASRVAPLPASISVSASLTRSQGKTSSTSSGIPSPPSDVQQSIGIQMDSSERAHLISSVGIPDSPPAFMKTGNLTDQHLFLFTTIACLTGGAMTALFVAAIPTLLAFRRAAESLEKLLEVTREELPGTMAAVRLSGMEISDLTMELSELGQEISSGVKNSARAVRAAQDGLRRMSSIASMETSRSSSRVGEGSSGTANKGSSRKVNTTAGDL